ncbi:ABC transporter family substrate-binding protein [Nocardia sp. CDC159]|uniref:ABC transporter family substrate-binding protein n=2 Tax=Nocardiaceae TaxID=85025 RepID=A0A9X2EAV8_9NOCA|nr:MULTISPECIES: ABC transporter family substrate-binding protein [Nocardia]MCM6776871.1 ABC transporter family substrate-binding protein [Nocardia pulmonis]MCM6789295.1 ABC transporter family substrate-binding protein [Nocardia sp. CDC159]
MGVGGCAAGGDEAGDPITLGAANDINPQPRETIRDGGNLRLATTGFPSNWNTLSNDGNNLEIARIVWAMMPRSFTIDAAGRTEVDKNYFTDIQLTGTDPQQVTYTINPEAVWSDGSPITWADIASQAHALSGVDKRYLIGTTVGFDRVEKVERGVDDRQAVITFKQHYAEWRGQFAGNAMLYPKSVTGDPETFNHGLADHITLTAGPFLVRSTDRTQGRIVLGRNPKWWGDTPKLDTITISVLDQNAWPQALQNKELDAAQLFSLSDVATVRGTSGLAVRRAPGPLWRHLTFNGAPGSILADPKLRVAISKAIDRQAIANAVLNGLEADPKPLNNHVFVRGQDGYRDNAPPFDPDAAARELDALGWKLNGDIREKDGRRLEIRDVMYNNETWVKVAQLIQQNLARVGVKLIIDARPGQNIFSEVFIPGDFDLAQFQWQGDAFPLSGLPQIYALNPDNKQGNFGRIGSPELNALIDRTLSELDPGKTLELANEADRMIFDEGFSLPLTQDPGNWGVRPDLANFGAAGLASYDYTKIGFTK